MTHSFGDFINSPRTAPGIDMRVFIRGGNDCTYLPAVNGMHRILGGETSNESGKMFRSREELSVIEIAKGNYAVHARYEIYLYDTKTTTLFDQVIPVLPKPLKPEGDERDFVKVGPEIRTVAYFTGSDITYKP